MIAITTQKFNEGKPVMDPFLRFMHDDKLHVREYFS